MRHIKTRRTEKRLQKLQPICMAVFAIAMLAMVSICGGIEIGSMSLFNGAIGTTISFAACLISIKAGRLGKVVDDEC